MLLNIINLHGTFSQGNGRFWLLKLLRRPLYQLKLSSTVTKTQSHYTFFRPRGLAVACLSSTWRSYLIVHMAVPASTITSTFQANWEEKGTPPTFKNVSWKLYIGFCTYPTGQNLTSQPALAARESGKHSLVLGSCKFSQNMGSGLLLGKKERTDIGVSAKCPNFALNIRRGRRHKPSTATFHW